MIRIGRAAALIGVHKATLRRWVLAGRVNAQRNPDTHKIWFTAAQINEIKQRMRVKEQDDATE